jgi:putative FmdB family regulatory protein
MPTYEYECKNCRHTFEVFQSMSEPPLSDCPECGKELRRLIHGGSGVIFKGAGFYVNDKHKTAGKTAASKPEEKSADKPANKGEGTASQSAPPCASCPAAAASCPAAQKAAG